MLEDYSPVSLDDYSNALREIIQQTALLGLWRSRFFEHAAFYGGTALRILYGLDRFSEDMNFSLKKPDPSFSLDRYGEYPCNELEGVGFKTEYHVKNRNSGTAIESGFLKGNTFTHLLSVRAPEGITRGIHPGKQIKIKLEVDTDPPGLFETESRFLLRPVPFGIVSYKLPDMFAGKLHAVLCRKWKNRVRGETGMIWYGTQPITGKLILHISRSE